MAKFKYVAVDPGTNKETTGVVEAKDKSYAERQVKDMGFYPTSVTKVAETSKGGKGGKGGPKKKGVKFAGEEDGSPAKSGRTGAASHSQQRTTSGGGSGTTQTHSGGTSTTQAGVAATQGVAVAVAGGLGRLSQERGKERSLLLPALATLGVGAAAAQEQPCYAALPSAAYVLADLHGCGGWQGLAFLQGRCQPPRLPQPLHASADMVCGWWLTCEPSVFCRCIAFAASSRRRWPRTHAPPSQAGQPSSSCLRVSRAGAGCKGSV